jgi:hypothetical protein
MDVPAIPFVHRRTSDLIGISDRDARARPFFTAGYTRILKTTLWTSAGQVIWQEGRWASCGKRLQNSPGSSRT